MRATDNGSKLAFKAGNATIYMNAPSIRGNGNYLMTGKNFAKIRAGISKVKKEDVKYVYSNGFLKGAKLHVPVTLLGEQDITLPPDCKSLKCRGKLHLDQRLRYMVTLLSSDEERYRHVYVLSNKVVLGNRSFVYMCSKSKSSQYIRMDKDIFKYIGMNLYTIYQKDMYCYLYDTYDRTVVKIRHGSRRYDNGLRGIVMPKKEKFWYMILDKTFKDIRSTLLKSWDPFVYVTLTKDIVAFTNNKKTYRCEVVQRGEYIPKLRFRIYLPYIMLFGPGYFYIDTQREILYKKDTLTKEDMALKIKIKKE